MKLNNQQIKEILENYSIGEFKSKSLVYNEWNTAYHLKTTNGDFLLKILNFQNEKELLKEIEVMNRLKKKIPCGFSLLSNTKKDYLHYNSLIVLIRRFIKGKPVLRGEKLSNKNLFQLGKYYATIHKTKDLSKLPKRDLYAHLQNYFGKIDKSSKEYEVAESTFAFLKNQKFNPKILPKGLIHADLHTENLLVNNGKIVAILDFEDSHIGSFVYDLGICILDTCWKKRSFSEERIVTFVTGYESIKKLTAQEKEHLIDSAILAGLYTLHFSIIKNGVNNKKNLNYYVVKRFLSLLKQRALPSPALK